MGKVYGNTMGVLYQIYKSEEKIVTPELRKQMIDQLVELENLLDKNYFAGDNLTLADISIFSTFSVLRYLGLDLSQFKSLNAWFERCRALKGFEENEKSVEIMADGFKALLKEGF